MSSSIFKSKIETSDVDCPGRSDRYAGLPERRKLLPCHSSQRIIIHDPPRDSSRNNHFSPLTMLRGQNLLRSTRLSSSHSGPILRPCTTRFLHSTTPLRAGFVAAVKEDYIKHHSQVKKATETHNFVNNQFQKSKTDRWLDLLDPATQNLVTRVPESTTEEMSAAVDCAEKAFKTWKNTSLLTRQQIMFRLATLIRENMDRVASSITLEQVPLPPPQTTPGIHPLTLL